MPKQFQNKRKSESNIRIIAFFRLSIECPQLGEEKSPLTSRNTTTTKSLSVKCIEIGGSNSLYQFKCLCRSLIL